MLQLTKPHDVKQPKVVTGLLKSSAKQSNATFASMFASAATVDQKGRNVSLRKGARRCLGSGDGEVVAAVPMKSMPVDIGVETKKRPVESVMERAERRQLERALQQSLSTVPAASTPVKEPRPGAYTEKAPAVFSPGTEARVDIGNLPCIVAASTGFLNAEEKKNLKETKAKHFSFMLSKRTAPLVQHYLGENLALVDAYCLGKDVTKTYISDNFRVYDLMSLLSTRPVSDAVLTSYTQLLQLSTSEVYFVDPLMFTYVVEWDKTSTRPFRSLEWQSYKYIVWPLNIGNWHWTMAVYRNEQNATIFYIDSLNEGSVAAAKEEIPDKLHETLSKMCREANPPISLNPQIEVLLVPRQVRGNNDCGMCVNECCRVIAQNPEGFLRGEVQLEFDTYALRCSQANALLNWFVPV